jgi:hypothetical protein
MKSSKSIVMSCLVAFALAFVGCAPTRGEQCARLVTEIDAANTAASQGGSGREELASLASAVDGARASVASLPLRDATLVELQSGYARVLARVADDARRMQSASESRDAASLGASLGDIRAASADEGAIAGRLAAYCAR